MKHIIRNIVEQTLLQCQQKGLLPDASVPEFSIEVPNNAAHGDFATNVAMLLAPAVKKAPRDIARMLVDRIEKSASLVERIEIAGFSGNEVREKVIATLKLVGLRHKADALPLHMSGGEQQRVVIARAIIGNPAVLLADEPTGNLDPETAQGIMDVFRTVHARGATILVATHDPDLYLHSGCRVLRLQEGRLVNA